MSHVIKVMQIAYDYKYNKMERLSSLPYAFLLTTINYNMNFKV